MDIPSRKAAVFFRYLLKTKKPFDIIIGIGFFVRAHEKKKEVRIYG